MTARRAHNHALQKNNEGFRGRFSRNLSEGKARMCPSTVASIDVPPIDMTERNTSMLAPLAINLLSGCVIMLAVGWAYDILHASSSLNGRNAHVRRLIARNERNTTIFHA
jgi:hypothetical protein